VISNIQQLNNIDKIIKDSVPEVVNMIASRHGIRTKRYNKELIFYSFATKYYSWHNLNNYPIYDRFVDQVLMAFKRKDNFSKFKQSDLKDFRKFKKVIQELSTYYGLSRNMK